MSYQPAVTSQSAQPTSDSWKAQAFINIFMKKKAAEGEKPTRIKLGAIPLKEAKKLEGALIKRLTEEPEAIHALLSVLELDFQLVDDPKAPATALPF